MAINIKIPASLIYELTILLLFVAGFLSAFGDLLQENNSILTKYHIHIINDLPPQNSTKLIVHCKSKDNDLGVKELGLHEEYGWTCRVNLFRTTLYFCLTKWGEKERYIVGFKAKRDQIRCKKNCLWLGRENGFFFSNDNLTWRLEYPW